MNSVATARETIQARKTRAVGAVHVHVMHVGQGALPQKNTERKDRPARLNSVGKNRAALQPSGSAPPSLCSLHCTPSESLILSKIFSSVHYLRRQFGQLVN